MIRTYKIIWTGSLKWPSIVFSYTHYFVFYTIFIYMSYWVFFNPDISFLFVFIDEIVKTTDTAEANFIRVIDIQPPPPWKKCNKILQYFINKKLPKRLLFALLTLFFTFLNEVIYASGYVIVFWLSNAIHGCTLNEIIQQKAT